MGEARGNGRHAARLAGYQGSLEVLDVQAARLLRCPRVREAIGRAVETETERRGLTRDYLVRKAHEILVEGRPFERLKAAELLEKLMGWFAPTHHVTKPSSPGRTGILCRPSGNPGEAWRGLRARRAGGHAQGTAPGHRRGDEGR